MVLLVLLVISLNSWIKKVSNTLVLRILTLTETGGIVVIIRVFHNEVKGGIVLSVIVLIVKNSLRLLICPRKLNVVWLWRSLMKDFGISNSMIVIPSTIPITLTQFNNAFYRFEHGRLEKIRRRSRNWLGT